MWPRVLHRRISRSEDRVIQANGGALRICIYRRADLGTRALPTCIFFHGGGFIAGSIETHDGICRTLADASSWQLISVDYRLAPENLYPAQIDDGLAVLDWSTNRRAITARLPVALP